MLLVAVGCAHAPPPAQKKPTGVRERLQAMTASLEREDFAGALRDSDAWLAERPEDASLIDNCRTWIRWGAGDKAGALAENEKLAHGDRGARLHYWWDKSYLLAEAGKLPEAEAARAEFDRLGNTPDDQDSRNVLEAWLLLRKGDGAGARKAAQRVDLKKDD